MQVRGPELVSTSSETTSQYSGFWWQDASANCDAIPEDAYYASGAFSQFILVVPSYDLVISRLGVDFPETPSECANSRPEPSGPSKPVRAADLSLFSATD